MKTEKEIRASMTSEQIQLERKLTCEAIDGAMAFGYQNTNPPPSDDHWLAPFWKIGRKQAELEASIADTAGAKYTQADMERYGKCYADARDKRRADTAGAKPVGSVRVELTRGGLEVGEPIIEFTPEFERKFDSMPGTRFDLFAATPAPSSDTAGAKPRTLNFAHYEAFDAAGRKIQKEIDAFKAAIGESVAATPAPSVADAAGARIERLRKGLFEARDAMRVMSNWSKKSDPAGYGWAVRMVDRANAILNHEPEAAAGASEGQAVEKIADELSTSHGHHVEDERNPDPVGHWWTFDREALAAFAKRFAHPSADEYCKAYAEEWQDTLKEQSAEIAGLRERIAGRTAQADDLRMLVQRLVHSLNKASPGNDLGAKALDYLMRNGLGASLLREDSDSRTPGWISVKDRLPDSVGTYLLYRPEAHVNPACDPNVTVRRYHGGGEFGGAHEVTHWMPLPGAPASSVASKEEPTS